MFKRKLVHIIRCSDGWMCSRTGSYEDAEKKALQYIAGRNITYVIV